METAERVILTETTLAQAVDELAGRDPVLDTIVARYGRPPLWAREPGFPTLVHIILEQQVSLASARAAFDRLAAAVTPLTPAGFLTLDDAQLKTVGFSRQKTRYGRELAAALLNGRLDLDALADLDDDGVRRELKKIAGIGDWTVDIYLLMALRRADVFPRAIWRSRWRRSGCWGWLPGRDRMRCWPWPKDGAPIGPRPRGCCGTRIYPRNDNSLPHSRQQPAQA